MGLRTRTRLKTLLLTLGILTIGMYTVINILASEFNMEVNERLTIYGQNSDGEADQSSKSYEYFVLKVQRKPKTTNLGESVLKLRGKKLLKSSLETTNNENNLWINKRYQNVNMNIVNNEKGDKILERSDTPSFNYMGNKNAAQYDNNLSEENYDENDEIDYEDDDYDDDANDDDDDDADDDEDNVKNYEFPTNAPFKPGDFGDIRGLEYKGRPRLQYERVKIEPKKADTKSKQPKGLTENGIYWSSYVENLLPKGLPYLELSRSLQQWRHKVVRSLQEPEWNKCGRPKNGYVVLDDGTKMCARYREHHDSFAYGESLSFHLSQLLQMDNVPGVVLTLANTSSQQWNRVNITQLHWKENKIVALIQWIENLNEGERSKAYIPTLLLHAYRSHQPITASIINNSSSLQHNSAHITEIVQWGSMIIFDYLTGNYDRVASMQDAEDREKKPKIIEESIHNLHKSSTNGKLWLIDNESGLLDAYYLLTPDANRRFETFHDKMLQTTCIFQSSIVKALRKLYKYPYPYKRLLHYAQSVEPLLQNISTVKPFELFVNMFDRRLKNVVEWINQCEKQAR